MVAEACSPRDTPIRHRFRLHRPPFGGPPRRASWRRRNLIERYEAIPAVCGSATLEAVHELSQAAGLPESVG